MNQLENKLEEISKDSEVKEYKEHAKTLGIEYVDLRGYPISSEVLNIISKEDALKYQAISYLRAGNKVKVATSNPDNEGFKTLLSNIANTSNFEFFITLTTPLNISHCLKLYDITKAEVHKQDDTVDIKKEDIKDFEKNIKSLRDLKEGLKKIPTTHLLDLILSGALKTEASDIHIESEEKDVIIRYRIDGILHPVISIDLESAKSILSRIKFLAKLKLDISKLPQDGKFFITYDNRRIDIRVSSLPEVYGESIVLRLFDKEAQFLRLEDLGFNPKQAEQLKRAYKKTHGIIFVVGPTGSGKTTTMYAVLDKLNKPGVKIITLEDPIEYNLPGIIQSQVNEDQNYTFALGLKSILRQDPDILLIGEVRDRETGEMSVQAALTGHLVLTTLHTNDAPSVIHRLIDLGVKPFLIMDAMNLIVAQRLIRKICPYCKEQYKVEEIVQEEIKKALGKKSIRVNKLFRGKGCDYCNHTGYKGRIGIFEFLEINDVLKELALQSGTLEDIKKAAVKSGMITMEEDGLMKAISGVTTPEEVWRVVRG